MSRGTPAPPDGGIDPCGAFSARRATTSANPAPLRLAESVHPEHPAARSRQSSRTSRQTLAQETGGGASCVRATFPFGRRGDASSRTGACTTTRGLNVRHGTPRPRDRAPAHDQARASTRLWLNSAEGLPARSIGDVSGILIKVPRRGQTCWKTRAGVPYNGAYHPRLSIVKKKRGPKAPFRNRSVPRLTSWRQAPPWRHGPCRLSSSRP
jgi:hypothetical protein